MLIIIIKLLEIHSFNLSFVMSVHSAVPICRPTKDFWPPHKCSGSRKCSSTAPQHQSQLLFKFTLLVWCISPTNVPQMSQKDTDGLKMVSQHWVHRNGFLSNIETMLQTATLLHRETRRKCCKIIFFPLSGRWSSRVAPLHAAGLVEPGSSHPGATPSQWCGQQGTNYEQVDTFHVFDVLRHVTVENLASAKNNHGCCWWLFGSASQRSSLQRIG